MKSTPSEPSKNEKHLRHHILSWYGDHKMLARLLILGALVLSVSGAYWHFSEGECVDINLNLAWGSTDVYEIEGNPAVRAYENEEIKLMVTVSTTKSGVLKITAKPESMKPVWLTMTKEDTDSWKSWEIEVYFHPSDNPLQVTSIPLWVKAKKGQDGLTLHGIIVEAFFVNEDCSKIEHAYIDVSKGSYPTPTPTPNDLERLIIWLEENPWAIGLLIIAIIGYILLRKH